MTRVTGRVAAGLTLPVEVLMKSAPAAIARTLARRTLSYVSSSPVSRITLRWVSPQASLTATISSKTARVVAGQEGAPVDDHVDLVGAGLDRLAGLGQLQVEEGLAGREAGGHAGDADAGRAQGFLRLGNERRIDADRGDVGDRRVARLRLDRLGAQGPDLARRVLSLERRQVHHPDCQVEGPQLGRAS